MAELKARFPDPLHEEATAYARSVGLSLNGLLMVAVREYLDVRIYRLMRRSGGRSAAVESAAPPPAPAVASAGVAPGAGAVVDAGLPPPPSRFKAPASRADPCPCGALDRRGYPLKWKHCHGRQG